MHVVMVTPFPENFNHIDGGVAGVARYLTGELKKYADIKLSIVVPTTSKQYVTMQEWDDVKIYRIGVIGKWGFLMKSLYDMISGKRILNDFLQSLKPDIVHFQGVSYLAAGYHDAKLTTIHGIMEKDALWDNRNIILRLSKALWLTIIEGQSRKKLRNLILINDYLAKYIPDKTQKNIWKICNPVDDSYFEQEYNPLRYRIVCCGRVSKLKNFLVAIKAFKVILNKFPEAELRIAGSTKYQPTYFKKCKNYVIKNGLQDRVVFLGNLSISKLQREFSEADCLVLTSKREISPLVISEAMVIGVPVVATDIGGVKYMVKDGQTGFLVPLNDEKALVDKISILLSNTSLKNQMSIRSKAEAKESYKASHVAALTVAAYKKVLTLY